MCFVCMSSRRSDCVWYRFSLLDFLSTRAWSGVCVCFLCLRYANMRASCVLHMCVMLPHLFMRAYAERSCVCGRFVCGMLTSVVYM